MQIAIETPEKLTDTDLAYGTENLEELLNEKLYCTTVYDFLKALINLLFFS